MMYITPCAGLSDSEAIQQAVNTAAERDIRTVVIGDQKVWNLDKPVLLPTGVTLILDGAKIRAESIAFTNANADKADKTCLGGEQDHIYLTGTKDASITSTDAPQVFFRNVQDFGISGIVFEGGEGLRLLHCRYGKIQKLRFLGSRYGVFCDEGCNNNVLTDILAETEQEAVIWSASGTTIWGRRPDIYDSILSRLDAKTKGAPAVAIYPGSVVANNLFIRDITDRTETNGVTVQLGTEGNMEVLDFSVRGVASCRKAVSVSDNCDGVFLSNLSGTDISPNATRVLVDDTREEIRTPQFSAQITNEFVDANDPQFAGATDWETLQNAINSSVGKALVIPRYNKRTGSTVWNIDKAICLPSNTTVILLDAHLRLADFTYCNIFTNAKNAKNIRIMGVGSATLDSGRPNGLKLKNANTLGFGPITDNALMLFAGVDGLTVENLHMVQNRWYCVLCAGCANSRLADLDICAHPIFPDMGGIRIHSGCRDMVLENITGLAGEDMIHIATAANDDDVFCGENKDISNIHIDIVKANASRSNIFSIKARDDRHIHHIFAENLLDCSLPEQKKLPYATAQIGDTNGTGMSDILVRDLNGRSSATVQLGGNCENVTISNIHSYGSSENALRTLPLPECFDFLLSGNRMELAELDKAPRATVKDLRVNGIFFRCQQASFYMRGTATSIITDKKKFIGTIVQLHNLQAENVVLENILADRVGNGIIITGKADVDVRNFQAAQVGREMVLCSKNCRLRINGEIMPCTESHAL